MPGFFGITANASERKEKPRFGTRTLLRSAMPDRSWPDWP
jgi:hypothetical protein